MKFATVVVTYNRYLLLQSCLLAIGEQSLSPDFVLVIDNASTDGTSERLRHWLPEYLPNAQLVTLDENFGGAGGFASGLQRALDEGADWVWMMDDDAAPHPAALEEMARVASDAGNIYGSVATWGIETSWTTTLLGTERRSVNKVCEIPALAEVQSLPFLGFMIHRDLVRTIGLPDAGYFIAADDIEYCVRAARAGATLFIAGKSHIEHPQSQSYVLRLFGWQVVFLKLPPWKRYYDTRNRLLIARKYYGFRLITQTIPGSFVRLFAALVHEPRRLAQLWAFSAGMLDGLLGIKGRRHTKWGIGQ